MSNINKKYMVIFFGILIAIMIASYILNTIVPAPYSIPGIFAPGEEAKSSYTTIRDTAGNVVLQTGLPVHRDDEYINEKDIHYKIVQVNGNSAIAEQKQEQTAQDTRAVFKYANMANHFAFTKYNPAKPDNGHHIVIYHTHSDESYIPTSGTDAKPGNGDIYDIGASMTDSLKTAGISVTHSYANHGPHDINAYHRSRRTLARLLKEQPDAAFDIHRDSAPLRAYATTINGIDTARVMIVVGRSNPNVRTNLNYARSIKKRADYLHPGLMRGIFIGRGDYNQDLYPTSLLFEIGSEHNSLQAAQKAGVLLTDAIISLTWAK
ncbi:MAG: stage II sporulation protein P [Syntrophomonadaceae bacterium]|jgi:stage II sporulation protein P